jgi:hypothetical protein
MKVVIRILFLVGFFLRLRPAIRDGNLFQGPYLIIDPIIIGGLIWLLVEEGRQRV